MVEPAQECSYALFVARPVSSSALSPAAGTARGSHLFESRSLCAWDEWSCDASLSAPTFEVAACVVCR